MTVSFSHNTSSQIFKARRFDLVAPAIFPIPQPFSPAAIFEKLTAGVVRKEAAMVTEQELTL